MNNYGQDKLVVRRNPEDEDINDVQLDDEDVHHDSISDYEKQVDIIAAENITKDASIRNKAINGRQDEEDESISRSHSISSDHQSQEPNEKYMDQIIRDEEMINRSEEAIAKNSSQAQKMEA